MRKRKTYARVRFSEECLRDALKALAEAVHHDGEVWTGEPWDQSAEAILDTLTGSNSIALSDEEWTFDNDEEFFRAYREDFIYAMYVKNSMIPPLSMTVNMHPGMADVTVEAGTRDSIERVFDVFERYRESAALPEVALPEPMIFIGHGRDPSWRDLKDHLQDHHGYLVVAFETQPRTGMTVTQVLEEMLGHASFAIFVLTGEDESGEGRMRARQNVIHEVGLFQGRLGVTRAIVLIEEGVEDLSNLSGVQYVSFPRGQIAVTFGPVLASLRREFSV